MVYTGWKNSRDPRFSSPRFSGSTTRAEERLQGIGAQTAYSGVVGKHPVSQFISTDEKELKFVENRTGDSAKNPG